MSPFIGSANSSTSSTPRLESAQSRDQILQEIALRRGIVRELDSEYIAWSLPKLPYASSSPKNNTLVPRGKSQHVRINLIALCSPGAAIFSGKQFAHFTATAETRCVRDIKRSYSWKVYGVSYNAMGEKAHYVRIQLQDKIRDEQFKTLATLLDAISAKRHVALPNIHPFGLGIDYSVPAPHNTNRIYAITHCAKATPYLRKVTVDFEIYLDPEWKRLDLRVDRIGFAVYKSASKSNILLAGGPEEVRFQHDPFVRFARMTLRFGERPERTYIDIENDGREKPCVITRSKKSSVVYMPRARVRTCDADGITRSPITTMVRLIFNEKEAGGLWGRGSAVAAAAEAEKMASLIRKTTRLAARNPLGIKCAVADPDIFIMAMKGVVAEKGYTVTNVEDGLSYTVDIREAFKGCSLYIVPSLRQGTNGIVLISHSKDGAAVLRQHIDNPTVLISSITESGFTVPVHSTLVCTKDGSRSIGKGNIRYAFNYGEADAGILVEMLVKLMTRMDKSRSTELLLAGQLAQLSRKRGRSVSGDSMGHGGQARELNSIPPSPSYSHSRKDSNASDVSNVSGYSTLSNTSTVSEGSSHSREPSDWDIYEAPCEISVMFDPSYEVDGKGTTKKDTTEKLARAKHAYSATLSREVDLSEGEIVSVRFRNNHWSFVKRKRDSQEGWVPTGYLDILC